MKIAQIVPLYESVPPKFYGGTERVVFYLTEELVRQGHEVTLLQAAIPKHQQPGPLLRYGSSSQSDLFGPVALSRNYA